MQTVQFTRIIDGAIIILTAQNKTNISSGEIVLINGYRYISKLI